MIISAGIFNQRRALIVANKLDICFTEDEFQHMSRQFEEAIPQNSNSNSRTSSEFSHYDRLHDHQDFESYIKEKVTGQIRYHTGIEVPTTCITPAILKWSRVSRDYYQGIQNGPDTEAQLKEWLDLHEPYREMSCDLEGASDEEIFEIITGMADIEKW